MDQDISPLPFLCPANLALIGAQQSGKSRLVMRMLQNLNYHFSPPPKKIMYCYLEWQDLFDEAQEKIRNIEFHQGLPTQTEIDSWSVEKDGALLILDDLISFITGNADMVSLFTVKCHHRNITTIMLSQSLYPPGKFSKTISLNCNYFLLFKNDRDLRQVKCLGGQMFPDRLAYFMDSYNKAVSRNFGYLCIDIHPKSNRMYQLRTEIMQGEWPIIFVPKA